MIPLTCSRLRWSGREVELEPAGPLLAALRDHVAADRAGGLVVLGKFGSGKSYLCAQLARLAETEAIRPCTVVPLRDVARHRDVQQGLIRVIGATRLAEARDGERVLLLDGLDEVPRDALGDRYPSVFDALVESAGPRWIMTSRPGFFRTDASESDDQVDTLEERSHITTLRIDALSSAVVAAEIRTVPGGEHLLASVDNLRELATSPLLLEVVRGAAPYIEPGRPIFGWGVFDAWIRHGLGAGDGAVRALEELAWSSWMERGLTTEVPTFCPDTVARVGVPKSARRALLVSELDGRLRFGHRSVYEFLLAARIAPELAANQGHGPDRLSGALLSEAVRVFLVGRTARMPVELHGGRARIPRGNFVAGGDLSGDERPLKIQHLAQEMWLSRTPVTHSEWAGHLRAHPDHRVDAHYLPHWGPEREMPQGTAELPIYGLWPEDADRYAALQGARLPTADEWEKAVRGLDGRRWPWGDYWRAGRAVTAELGTDKPLPVRALGAVGDAALFDAVGGVFEYTSTAYRGRPGWGRVVMGGCFTHNARVSRASLRLSHKLSGNLKAGLRLAWSR